LAVTRGPSRVGACGAPSGCPDDAGFGGVGPGGGGRAAEPIEIGDHTFLGRGSILRGGPRLGDDSLLGVMTLSPRQPASGTSWLGVPALELPRTPDAGDPSRTTAPPRRLRLPPPPVDPPPPPRPHPAPPHRPVPP